MSAARSLRIDIWSDVMCPWCLIGYGQLQKAFELLAGEIAGDIRWHAFELNPDMPGAGQDQQEHIQQKYRRPPQDAANIRTQMRRIASDAGVSLEYKGTKDAPPAMMWNTFDAHRLLAWALDNAGAEGQMELKLALFAAHFNHRRNIGEPAVLVEIADELGLDGAAAASVLSTERYANTVRRDEQRARDLDITGVPAMLVEDRFMIQGAQEPEAYANTLRRIASRI